MNAKHWIIGALVLVAPALALAQVEEDREEQVAPMREALPRTDAMLVRELHRINLEQIALGQLAEEMSSRENVKRLGRMLVNDHRATDEKLVALATEHGLSLPEAMDMRKLIDPLREQKGDAFNRRLLTRIADEHHRAIKLVKRHRDEVKPELQALLADLLPALRHHHHEAREMGGARARARPARTYRP